MQDSKFLENFLGKLLTQAFIFSPRPSQNSFRRNKVISHTFKKFLQQKEDDNIKTQPKKSSSTQENAWIVTQPVNLKLLKKQLEETSMYAPSVPSLDFC